MSYPAPPWQTHGHAFVQPFVVDAPDLVLPPGFEPVRLGGRTAGVLGYIEYVSPSPLVYRELVWMPCMVRVTADGRMHRGYYVDKMYVDSEASLEAGRTEWSLPKQLARFTVDGGTVRVDTEDGATLELQVGARGPKVASPVASKTLQDAGDHVVRFKGKGTAQLGSGYVRVKHAHGVEDWSGFASARRLRGVGVALGDFAIEMQAPVRIEHVLH